MAEQTVTVPQGTFELLRHPFRERSTLQAWDAADRYALSHIDENVAAREPVAVVNEGFGLLTTGLHRHSPFVVADSAMSILGIGTNLERNALSPISVLTDVSSLPGDLATVVIKVPKSLGQLEEAKLGCARRWHGEADSHVHARTVRIDHWANLDVACSKQSSAHSFSVRS